jgi:hypothetical protein
MTNVTHHKRYLIGAGGIALLLLSALAATLWAGARPTSAANVQHGRPLDLVPTDVITVTSTLDDGGMSERCDSHSPCTLRRALNEARWYSDPGKVFHITFDLGTGDPGYDGDHEVWIIEVDSSATSEKYAFRSFGTHGQVIVDGTTQPIGRDPNVGPRVILRGDNAKGAFNLTGGRNVVRGLAFQGFGDEMVNIPATNENLIEGNWFGLTVTGTAQYLRNPLRPEDGSGEAGIFAQKSGSDGISNTVQLNVLLGFKGSAIDVQGDANAVLSNTVGARADGTVPEVRPERRCRPNARHFNWFGGAGIDISGHGNRVEGNRVVGLLFRSNDPLNTPDDAISVSGRDHVIQHNTIGVASDGAHVGTCGDGIHVGGASGAHVIQVRENTIVGAHGAAGILVTSGPLGYDMDAVTVQGNVMLESRHEAFAFGDLVPTALRLFEPAAVTQIDGVNVTGTSGADSLCENCTIELFLDRVDTVTETLESLGTATADGSGNWTFTLARTLALTEGLRTASTTVADGQIQNASGTITYSAGTTTKISPIYTQAGAPEPTPPEEPAPLPPLPYVEPVYRDPPTPPSSVTTVITVTSAGDPDDRADYVCYATGLTGKTPMAPCTLRRALVEADSLMDEDPGVRPIEIRFDLDTGDPGYDSGLGLWVIQITDTLESNALPTLGSTDVNKSGQVIIDGDSQPGGRSTGPKIILRGPANRELSGYGLVVNGENNVIRGLGFQDFRMTLQLNHARNIVEDNWFGLTDDGQEIYLRKTEAPQEGSGQSGIKAASAATNTLIQNNTLAGYYGAAIDVEGSDSYVRSNWVGTRADGTVPEVAWNRWCMPNARYHNWFGGAGVEIGGSRNIVEDNRIAGLLWYSADPENTPDTALDVMGGDDHLIQNNIIGVDAGKQEVGSCGRGIVVEARYTRVLSNTVVRTKLEPFRISGSGITMNALYFRNNVAWDSAPVYLEWGNFVPEARAIFTPAQVLTITVGGGSTTVEGDEHPDAPCPYCQIELFREDLDEVTETLESLAVVQAGADGTWHAVLPFEMTMDDGLRTTSTTRNYGTMENFDYPSTSGPSTIYSRTGATLTPPPAAPAWPTPPVIPEPAYLAPPTLPLTYATTVTVTTSDDSNTSQTQTCADVAADACSLRLAINQVEHLSAAERPARIAFDIPTSDVGYDLDGFWVITLSATALPPVKGGQVVIDGTTQQGGRINGPSILVRRASQTGATLHLGETQFEGEHGLVGLALQGVEVHMNGSHNVVTHNWLGIAADGQSIYLYGDDPSKPNHAIIQGFAESDHNHIAHNALAGSTTNAINLQGYDSLIEHNTIGTLPDGTIPAGAVAPEDLCEHTQLTGNWYGGGGLYLSGKRHRVRHNVIAGLMLYGSATQTQPAAVRIAGGQDHAVAENRIGVDMAQNPLWTCGPAIENTGASFTRIEDNVVMGSDPQGLFVNGTVIAINATTMRSNVLSDSLETGAWSAIEWGDGVPEALSLFSPALVTVIDQHDVTGVSDDPCPYCQIDLFLDDDDPTTEATAYLGTTKADASGDWSFTLPMTLPEGMGLRTLSTTRDYGVVPHFEAGTSSALSILFTEQPPTAPDSVSISGPAQPVINTPLTFVASVSPVTTTLPITYTWEATGQDPQTGRGGTQHDVTFTWTTPGSRAITVTATNPYGSATGYRNVNVKSGAGFDAYLPLALREK